MKNKHHIELISGRRYYGKSGAGWVVLIDGSAHHFTGKTAKADAKDWIEQIENPSPIEKYGVNWDGECP